MKRRKSEPGDEKLIYDETINSGERASAIFRLAVDGYREMQPLIVSLLTHKEEIFRGDAIKTLLQLWHLPEYLDYGLNMLNSDPSDRVRSDAAFAVGEFGFISYKEDKCRELITQKLVDQLIKEESPFTRKTCYEEIVRILGVKRYIEEKVIDDFSLERDVDWELLKPYLNKNK